MSPLEAGFIVLIESLAWGSAAVVMSSTRAEHEPRLIRCGSATVIFGLVAMGLCLSNDQLAGLVVAIIFLNGGMGMMWGYIIKRVVGAAPAEEKDRTASLLPITQQSGFALGAALCGLIANGLGLESATSSFQLQQIAFWLFISFVPVAVLGNWLAWRFVGEQHQN